VWAKSFLIGLFETLIASHIEQPSPYQNAFLHVFHAPSTPYQTF